MNIDWMEIIGSWERVKASARTTINRSGEGKTPDSEWKRSLLLAEHSPIRKLKVAWRWANLPYWVSVHFARHKVGIEHFVGTQRTDRTGEDRDDKPQNAPVCHECEADAQAVINISRKRLCNQASPETRRAWQVMLMQLKYKEPELYSVCVPECVYRGFCPELKSCGYVKTEAYKDALMKYREGHE